MELRLLPQDIGTERAILGALMEDKYAIEKVMDLLTPECFYKVSHQYIYSAIVKLYKKSISVDIITVTQELIKNNKLESVGGSYYLTECIDNVTRTQSIIDHADIIYSKMQSRKCIIAFQGIVDKLYNDAVVDEVLIDIDSTIIESLSGGITDIITLKDAIQKTISATTNKKADILSHLYRLDEKTGGFENGEYIIIAGRTSMGKTSLAVQIFVENINRNIPIGFITLESPDIQITRRIISNQSRYSVFSIKNPPDDYVQEEIGKTFKGSSELPGYLCDVKDSDINYVKRVAVQMVRNYKIKLLIIDYIQLINTSFGESKHVKVSEISRELRMLAKKLNIPIIILSQLTRPEKGKINKPLLTDLKESGSLENDANKVIFIHRDKYYNIESTEPDLLIVAKNRDGETGPIDVEFEPKCMRFK